jgi:formate/nitrite transporter FocA (FNT family)
MPYTPSTLPPAQVAEAIVAQGVAKHRTRIDRIFFKAVRPSSMSSRSLDNTNVYASLTQVLAGIMLSFGGLMSQIVSDGSPQMTQNNPGLVMILSGFVFPVGLIM